jgi:hypothetical protein
MIYILLYDTQRMGQTRRVPELHHSTFTEEIVTLPTTSSLYIASPIYRSAKKQP